jgi:carboxypeptidase C (cathepsin A)
MVMRLHTAAGAACALLLLTTNVTAQAELLVTTNQSIVVNGTPLRYTAQIGRIPIKDAESGEPHGYMGFIAYRVPTRGAARPVTLLWNGGPGANSTLLHFEAVGPRRIESGRLVDNQETVLASTDLVFVDPIGTGFSRPTKPEYGGEFYQTNGDVRSVTEFVRAWRLLFDATDAPLFVGGESWGSGRAAAVALGLERMGVRVRGTILISGGTALRSSALPRELALAHRVMQVVPTALYHGRLSPDLGKDTAAIHAQIRRWAADTYAPALARVDSLTDAGRDSIASQLSRFTGFPVDRIDRKTLQITPRQLLTGYFGAEGKTLNTFDMRRTSGDADSGSAAAIERYLRRDLGYRTDLQYIGLGGASFAQGYSPTGTPARSVGARWDYFSGTVSPDSAAVLIRAAAARGGGPPGPPREPATSLALELNPALRVHIAGGNFDSLNNCEATHEQLRRLEAKVRANITYRCYVGGHMFYRDAESRRQFSADIRALVTSAR